MEAMHIISLLNPENTWDQYLKIIIKKSVAWWLSSLFSNHKTASLSMWWGGGKEANMTTTKNKVTKEGKAFIEIVSFGSVNRNTSLRSRIILSWQWRQMNTCTWNGKWELRSFNGDDHFSLCNLSRLLKRPWKNWRQRGMLSSIVM